MSTLYEEQFAALPNGIRICFSSHGDGAAPPVLLIAGLGLQMVSWPAALIERLVEGGLRVICFDNRDAGRSSRSATPHPSSWDQLRGRAPTGSYGIEEMANDTALLLEHLQLDRVHLVGMSMGGMIAQTLASQRPQVVASLVSIFSTTGHRKVGQPAFSTKFRMARARAPRNLKEAVESYRQTMMHIGDPTAPGSEEEWRSYSTLAWMRNGERADSRALLRQMGAIFKSGDRTEQLKRIQAPSLIIHGDIDRIVHPSGGAASAKAIPNARHEVIRGMRHQIDTYRSEHLASLILNHVHKYSGRV